MPVTSRLYQSDHDFVAVRRLLQKTHGRPWLGFNWDLRRWDGHRWYRDDPIVSDWPVRLWFDGDNCVGAAHDEGPGIAVLAVDSDHRSLESEMLEWIEEALPSTWPTDTALIVHALEPDSERQTLLQERGYHPTQWGEVSRSMGIGPSKQQDLPDPYRLDHLRGDSRQDRQHLADLLNAAFGRTGHGQAEFATFFQHTPDYRDDLHLVARSPDGSLAAHAATNLDPVNRVALIEPVCTHPEHRSRGLASSLIREAVRRAGELGATTAEVYPGLDAELNSFYAQLGLDEEVRGRYWQAPD